MMHCADFSPRCPAPSFTIAYQARTSGVPIPAGETLVLRHNFPALQLSLPISVNLMHTVRCLALGAVVVGATSRLMSPRDPHGSGETRQVGTWRKLPPASSHCQYPLLTPSILNHWFLCFSSWAASIIPQLAGASQRQVQLLVPGCSYCGAYFGWQHLKAQRKMLSRISRCSLAAVHGLILSYQPWSL